MNHDMEILVSNRVNDRVEIPRYTRPFPTSPQYEDFRSGRDQKNYIAIVMPVMSQAQKGPGGLFPEFEGGGDGAGGEEELIGYVCLGLNQERMQREAREFLIRSEEHNV